MAKLYYRGMVADDDRPKLGRSARLLGIRPGVDIDVASVPKGWLNRQGYLRIEVKRDNLGAAVEVAIRNTKGLSVSLSIEGLPPFRKPVAFGGSGKDPLWQIDDRLITGDLEAVQDGATHVSILPSATMTLEKYEAAISATQPYWQRIG
ncbi:hypothetical protein [cf. Phormidesmis sp. LEGE 11477]|uniref:Tse2 family ADP-ribosyltransferase toxin n=1 Tax=cf. Phormidesmis sp. LEGE 11477 TaxID=1828680 RepID=UPI001882E7DC|nr:hypothetical protein [cf. Phormidesmis sp. LEGE 11477]MBE9064593.1 hypothetical protein [cf. Phormidesmis sp. LEGE 11477]